MKKWLILIALLTMMCALPSLGEEASQAPVTVEMDGAALTLDPATMEVRFTPKGSVVAYSTLVLQSSSGSRAMKNLQKSSLSVQYIANALTGTTSAMDSFSMSVDLGEAVYEQLPDGFRITYTIGANELVVDDLPKMIPLSVYNDRLRPAWTERNDKTFRDNYRIVPRQDAESIFVRIKDDLGRLIIKQLHELIFDVGGFTPEEMETANAEYGYEIAFINPKITLSVDYRISQGDLLITVPLSEVETTKENDLISLDILPYFLSAGKERTGYLFVPDGPGGLIYFNNNKQGISAYSASIYGEDPVIRADEYRAPGYPINLPIYGIKQEDGAILAIIEQGAELATITADISGHSDDYNRVFSTFTIRDVERVAMGGNKTVTTPRYAQDTYMGDIAIRYRFLPGENTTWVDMANAFREYLLAQGTLLPRESDAHAPLFVEIIGAVKKQKFFLGIPYNSTVQATTIAQAGQIYGQLKAAGISNIQLLYSGLFTQGVKHAALNNSGLDGGVGSARDLTALADRLDAAGDTLYPVVNLGKVYSAKGFSAINQAARKHDGSTAQVYEPFEPQLQSIPYQGSAYLAPQALKDYVAGTLKRLESYRLKGLDVSDLGNTLVGTYKRNQHTQPIHARPLVTDALAQLNTYKLLLDCPNLYALPYADILTNIPLAGSGHKLLDAGIPFMQAVYDGSLPYSCSSWNLSAQVPLGKQLLYAMEGKSAPRFTITWEKPTIFHNTRDLSFLGYFSTWHEESVPLVVQAYKAYDAFYQQVKDARIKTHRIDSDTLRTVTYDNGVTLYLNYGDTDSAIDGVTVPAQGYALIGGE